ncbi:hypothetical protein H2201_003158 [Coniosporium apollinis]|uniref:Uncharacterized protein n=2 Tax=Coniosporium TaxID=2810619 RepID=A0ABQ9NZR4_9PEZI|nr:hypothetical protein H2199_008504 [Cladosporium sp. JES 115]KAJ9666754.1 hypothetical protein H2201_003158 [Coniosporium apollinis]
MSQQQQIRRLVMTGAVAAVTVTGAWYGAGLKTRQEFKQEKKVVLEASPQERISQLENARARLVTRRTELEKKISELQARRNQSSTDTRPGT